MMVTLAHAGRSVHGRFDGPHGSHVPPTGPDPSALARARPAARSMSASTISPWAPNLSVACPRWLPLVTSPKPTTFWPSPLIGGTAVVPSYTNCTLGTALCHVAKAARIAAMTWAGPRLVTAPSGLIR